MAEEGGALLDRSKSGQDLMDQATDPSVLNNIIHKSTSETFRNHEAKFYGAYAEYRKKLDYKYHVHYKKERQWLHDSIIEDVSGIIFKFCSLLLANLRSYSIFYTCHPFSF
jgi:hypothetical protein